MPKLGPRDPRLSDPQWMASRLAEHGEMWIAIEVGVTRTTVRRRLAVLGIPSQPVGRRRGVTTAPAVRQDSELDPTMLAVRDRYEHAKHRRVPPTTETLAAALRAAHEAERAGDTNAYDDALIDGAAAFALIHDHRQKLRRAA